MDTVIPISAVSDHPVTRGPIRQYFGLVKEVLLEPGHFFRLLAPQYDLLESLTYGLVSVWISGVLSFIWSATNKIIFVQLLQNWIEDVSLSGDDSWFDFSQRDFLIQTGYLVLTPFFSLIGLTFSALVMLSFAKLFISDENNLVLQDLQLEREEKINFKQCLKIMGFASLGTWFRVVPIFGGALSYFAVLLLAMIGVRESFKVSTKRAALVIFLPQLLFFMIAILLIGTLVLMLALLPWDQIMDMQSVGGDDPEALIRFLHF